MGRRYCSDSNIIFEYEKVNRKTHKVLKVKKENVFFVDELKVRLLLNKWLGGKILWKIENAKLIPVHQCLMHHGVIWSVRAIHLIYMIFVIVLNANVKNKLLFFLDSFNSNVMCFGILWKKFKGSQNAWDSFLKPEVDTIAPANGMAVGAKSKNAKTGQALTNILKSISREES